MTCKIQPSFYSLIERLVLDQHLECFSVQPVHKGFEYDFKPAMIELDKEKVEEEIAYFIESNEIEPSVNFFPFFKNSEMLIRAEFYTDMNDLYFAGENWDFSKLIKSCFDLFVGAVGSEFIGENVFLDLELEIEKGVVMNIASYQLDYRDDQGVSKIDLSNNINLKNEILEYAQNWALQNCIHEAVASSTIYFSINENTCCGFGYGYVQLLSLVVFSE